MSQAVTFFKLKVFQSSLYFEFPCNKQCASLIQKLKGSIGQVIQFCITSL